MAKQPEGSDFLDAGGCCVNPESQQARLQPQNWQLGSGTVIPMENQGGFSYL